MNVLFIDATVRKESRTLVLAKHLLSKLNGNIKHIKLDEEDIYTLDNDTLNKRTKLCIKGDYSDKMFNLAHDFVNSDVIVIAAPYWDLSFPASLKRYLEAISINGLTFYYNDQGIPVGLAKAKCLYYVTTAGGYIYNDEYGYGYVRDLTQKLFGVKDTKYIKAEGLDIIGNDANSIINDKIKEINNLF